MSPCTCQKYDVGHSGIHSECTVSTGSESPGHVTRRSLYLHLPNQLQSVAYVIRYVALTFDRNGVVVLIFLSVYAENYQVA
jgi:hypothetical protein